MMYHAYQAFSDFFEPVRWAAAWTRMGLDSGLARNGYSMLLRNAAALSELTVNTRLTHRRPDFGIETVMVGNQLTQVSEEPTEVTPFGTLLHFKKDVDTIQPRVLVVAPMSGHYATLLAGTVKTLLPEHDVFLTDWHNARDIAVEDGRFDLDSYIEHMIRWIEVIGPGAHVVAVCQPCVAALAAVAVMAEAGHPDQPRSMTLMAGPIDCRINPTKVNELATSKPIEWFERMLISTVPYGFAGSGRRVYPGFLQLTAFMSMNLSRHVKAHMDLYRHLLLGDTEKAATVRTFYDEYFAVADLPAEFYLTTVKTVFQDYDLALGRFRYQGRTINPAAIRRTALLTVEGERDDICSIGQTLAAQDLCRSIRPYMKRHHMQTGVGHYGVFSGNRWNSQVYPIVRNMILANN
ncbi:MAG TPA: polyhydroxyalkanoate depolymerase [Alphaproteobacteria bacterium]|nr:polyhydroxyalkanoate depolymerase [Alphaproteobacteria bacterium]